MSVRSWSRRRSALVLAIVVAAASAVVSVAQAAPSRDGKEMRVACERNGDGQLRYAARARACRSSERAIRFDRTRIVACARRGGSVYRVAGRAACRRAPNRPSLALAIPGRAPTSFCADRDGGVLRSTAHAPYEGERHPRPGDSSCKDEERRVFVQRANRRPRAERDVASTDATAVATIRVLDNDTDPDGDRLRVASVDRGTATGTVAVAPGRRAAAYDPSGRFTALGAGASATETFSYRATDGRLRDRATVTVTVRGVNDGPLAAADGAATDERTPVTIAVLANDSDPDTGDLLRVTALDTAGTHGAVALNPDGTVGYDPRGAVDVAAGGQQTDTFTYAIGDGHGGTASATVTVIVRGTGAAPVVTTSAGTASWTEGGPDAVVDPGLTVTDADDAELTGARIQIAAGFSVGDVLELTDQPGMTETYDAADGILTLDGTLPVAAYQAALRLVRFRAAGADPAAAVRRIEFSARDADASGPPATRDVVVTPVDNAPVAVDDAAGVVENDPATAVDVLANDTDVDGGPKTITAVTQPADGAAAITGGGTGLTYQPDAGFCGTDDFTYELNGIPTATATVSVTVTCVDDAPDVDASAGALAYTEDDPATAIDTGLTVTDADSANLTGATVRITGNFAAGEDALSLPGQPAITGVFSGDTLTLSGTATVAEYQDALRAVTYENTSDAPSTATRTVTFQARDAGGFGGADTHAVTVAAVDDAPVAVDDGATVLEDAAATAVPVLANDTDADVGPRSIASVTQPADGTVVITGGGTGLTYAPDANVCNDPPGTTPDTFTYTLTPGGASATVSMTVTCVGDDPSAVDDSATVAEDSGTNAVDVLANDTDVDAGAIGVASVTQPANGTVAITGGGTGLSYAPSAEYCNSPPGTTPDTFTYMLSPGGSVATVSMTVTCADDVPSAVDDAATVAEDSGASPLDVLGNDTDPDGGALLVTGVTQPANGTVVDNDTNVSYAPAADYCNDPPGSAPDTFTYTVTGGDTATVSVTVTCAADAPVVDASAGATAYTENGAAEPIDPGVTVTDPDAGTQISGATVQITANFAAGQDVLALSGSHGPITAGLSGDTLTLTGTATPAAYQAALRAVTYVNSSETPSALARTATFTVTDATALSGSDTKAITVAAADDPPVAVDDGATVLEDAGATAVPVLANDTDVDGGPIAVASVTQPADGTVVITGGGTGLTYAPDADVCNDPPGTTADTFTYTLTPGGASATVSMTVTCVNDAPVADDETFAAVGNTALIVDDPTDGPPALAAPRKSISGDVLAGDTDIDGPPGLSVVPGTFASDDGGTVVIEADGDFTFTPAAGTSCSEPSDFFDYTVSDGNPGTPGTDTGRVTITLTGCVWYVDNDDPGNAGTSTAPFDTLAQAESASAAGHTVFVLDGDGTTTGYTAGIDLKSGQRLLGEAATLQIGSDVLQTADPAARPTLTDTGADVVALDDGNVVRGIEVDPQGAGSGIAGASGDTGGGTIDDVRIVDTGTAGTQPGLELDGTAGTFDVSSLTVDNSAATAPTSGSVGVRLNNAGTVNLASAGTISITTKGARGLEAAGTSLGAGSEVDSITVTASGSGGVSLTGTTGTTTFGNLALTTTSGSTAAFLLGNAGNVTVPSGGTANVSATGGPAVDVSGTSGPTLVFDTVSSTNSAGNGINLDGLGPGAFSASGGTLTGAAGIAFRLNAGSGAITYPGSVGDGTGSTASVTGRTGGVVSLSGSLNDGGDAGGGIALSGSTGGATVFSGAAKVLNTGAQPAINATGNAGHTYVFSGGGLDLDTTSGAGLIATGGGTLQVSGSGNTVDTGTGTAVNVADTSIAAAGVTFQRVAANGAANGIVLDNTGTAAGLTVTGVGGACATTADACTGGTIQSTTGDALSLATTRTVSLTRMKIRNSLGNGIRGDAVTNLALADSVVDNNGDDAATDEAGLHLTDLAGTSSVVRTLVANSPEDNARIVNASATLTQLDVTDSTFRDTDTASPGNDGLLLQADGGAITADVLGSTFLRNRANGLQVITNGTGSMNVEVDDSAGAQSTFDDNNIGVSIAHNASGTFSYAVRDLTIDGIDVAPGTGGSASPINLNLATGATTTMNGTVTGNTLTNSNSTTGPGIRVIGNGTATMTALLQSNTISQVANRGIEVIARDGSNRINATVADNSVTLNDALAADAIRVDAGSVSTDTTTICADIRGNTASTTAVGLFGIRVRQRFPGTSYILEDYAGAPTDDAAVQAFLSGTNNAATASADHGGAGFTSTADCPTPP